MRKAKIIIISIGITIVALVVAIVLCIFTVLNKNETQLRVLNAIHTAGIEFSLLNKTYLDLVDATGGDGNVIFSKEDSIVENGQINNELLNKYVYATIATTKNIQKAQAIAACRGYYNADELSVAQKIKLLIKYKDTEFAHSGAELTKNFAALLGGQYSTQDSSQLRKMLLALTQEGAVTLIENFYSISEGLGDNPEKFIQTVGLAYDLAVGNSKFSARKAVQYLNYFGDFASYIPNKAGLFGALNSIEAGGIFSKALSGCPVLLDGITLAAAEFSERQLALIIIDFPNIPETVVNACAYIASRDFFQNRTAVCAELSLLLKVVDVDDDIINAEVLYDKIVAYSIKNPVLLTPQEKEDISGFYNELLAIQKKLAQYIPML